MKRFKTHIGIFFLMGFLFPQAASSMHYFFVSHQSYNSGRFDLNKLNDFEYHSCIYHLNGSLPLILCLEKLDEPGRYRTPVAAIKFCCLENYVQQPDFDFQLRGPPYLLN